MQHWNLHWTVIVSQLSTKADSFEQSVQHSNTIIAEKEQQLSSMLEIQLQLESDLAKAKAEAYEAKCTSQLVVHHPQPLHTQGQSQAHEPNDRT